MPPDLSPDQPIDRGAVDAALTSIMREERGRVLALLTRQFGDLDLADDAVAHAMADATRSWRNQGIPDRPAAWLFATARRRAIDLARRSGVERRHVESAGIVGLAGNADHVDVDDSSFPSDALVLDGDDDIDRYPDERLRLILLCCHPALDQEAQVALTLRLVAGLTTAEIAAAFLIPEATLAQRIVRAKRKIRDAGIPLSLPAALSHRLNVVITVIYLVFNEGYLSRGERDTIRVDMIDEAIRLTQLVRSLTGGHPELDGLLALELFARARSDTRTDANGELVLLADQDRTRWNLPMIEQAQRVLIAAMAENQPGPFQIQALIASHHATARTAGDTDWATVASLYAQLVSMTDSPVVRLNHAIAVAEADGPRAGLAILEHLDATQLDRYHLFHAALGELLARDGRRLEARSALERALELADNETERRHLRGRILRFTDATPKG